MISSRKNLRCVRHVRRNSAKPAMDVPTGICHLQWICICHLSLASNGCTVPTGICLLHAPAKDLKMCTIHIVYYI